MLQSDWSTASTHMHRVLINSHRVIVNFCPRQNTIYALRSIINNCVATMYIRLESTYDDAHFYCLRMRQSVLTPSVIPVSGQGFPKDRMRAGGFCHYCIMHTDSCYTLNHKVQATIPQWGRMGMRYTNTVIMTQYQLSLKMDAGGGPETVLPLGVA